MAQHNIFRLAVITTVLSAAVAVKSPANSSVEHLESCGLDRTIILRKKRFLTFPPRSELLFRMSLLKSTPWKTNVYTIHELDVQVPIPENLHAILFERSPSHHKSRTKENYGFVEYFKVIASILGLNGQDCPDKLQCELSRIKPNFLDKSFPLQVLHLLLRHHKGSRFVDFHESCSEMFTCPISFVPEFLMENA